MNQQEIDFQAKKMHILSEETSLKMYHTMWTVEEIMSFHTKMSAKETRKVKHEGSSLHRKEMFTCFLPGILGWM